MSKNILIFRIGSMGDTLIALPIFRKIRSSYPGSKITLLTNNSVSTKACSIFSILEDLDLVDNYVNYNIGVNGITYHFNLLLKIKRLNIDEIIYIMPRRSLSNLLRDWLFFQFCGVKKIIGLRFTDFYQESQYDKIQGCWEHELVRLSKLISILGSVPINHPSAWELPVLDKHHIAIEKYMKKINTPYFVFSLGTKVSSKDWGQDRWDELIKRLASLHGQYGLVVIGSNDEFESSQSLLNHWSTASLNLCGKLNPLESAAVLKNARLFIGHDSGPMHLAASVLTPVVAIFSARNKPGQWYPLGINHTVIYHQTECFGCGLDDCFEKHKICIRSISVDEVFDAVHSRLLSERFT